MYVATREEASSCTSFVPPEAVQTSPQPEVIQHIFYSNTLENSLNIGQHLRASFRVKNSPFQRNSFSGH